MKKQFGATTKLAEGDSVVGQFVEMTSIDHELYGALEYLCLVVDGRSSTMSRFVYLPLRITHAVTYETLLASTTCEVADSMRMGHSIPSGIAGAENEDDDVVRNFTTQHLRYNLADHGVNGIEERARDLAALAVQQLAENPWHGVERRTAGVRDDIALHAAHLAARALAVLPADYAVTLDVELPRHSLLLLISDLAMMQSLLREIFKNPYSPRIREVREQVLRLLVEAVTRHGRFARATGAHRSGERMMAAGLLADVLFPDMSLCWRDAIFSTSSPHRISDNVCALHAAGRVFAHRFDDAGESIPSNVSNDALPPARGGCTMERILHIHSPPRPS